MVMVVVVAVVVTIIDLVVVGRVGVVPVMLRKSNDVYVVWF
jgi:hypothetical protein